ncbi:DUF5615 family PIN-like protein [Sphingomonas sp. SUN039]|uniref:DUF5615 family PIN-like protein n=1 Tax=Sphingomonas sp. SUN039 TaxID=2937787 RepID=UPI0021643108|nr:DUF5615 family PIN-like protein [Sphingomonas sp. SUN039]UVO55397.1 DUF5615 family PIN-like protein [Sphingomonas sp. SUN039]
MRIVIDMNLSPRWAAVLEDSGIAADHWTGLGAPTASDGEIMTYAAAHGAIVLTNDLDFGAILAASGESTPSVVQIRADDVSPEAIGVHLVRALRQMADELAAGALVTVEPARARISLLPLSTG